jgi:HAD superfamily hydrolase (TIGR01509 family)
MIVVFDIGNVLVRWDRRYLYRKVFDDEERMEHFLATALAMDFVSQTDAVEDFAVAIAARAEKYPEFAKEIRMFHERWIETLGEPIEENVALLRRLRASGKPVYALSNFAHETFALAERKHDFLSEFDDRVISGHVGFAKPDADIYEILFKRAGRRPGELLFIDDSPANVHASEALGMPAIHFGPGVDLEKELVSRGALP